MPKKRTPSRGSVARPYAEPKLVPGPGAFRDLADPGALCSQAATLLLIGSHLRGDALVNRARAQAAFAAAGEPQITPDPLPQDDLSALGFPELAPDPQRFSSTELQRSVGAKFASVKAAPPAPREAHTASQLLPLVADRFFKTANSQTAAALLEVSLRHPSELVRCAAAASYFEVAADASQSLRVLEHGVASRDVLTADVAACALANVDPRDPALAARLRLHRRVSRRKPSRTSTIIHGTWAAGSPWWQPPSGDFWTYLHSNVDSSLYGAQDRFGWSGGYSDAARTQAATALSAWVQSHSLQGLDLHTHSHGGNVAMLASHLGMTSGKMVLLSCPVHWPRYSPDFTRVTKVISVRVHLDLVILADRGGQKFADPRIEEHVLPIWFDHSASHTPAVWTKYNVKQWIVGAPPAPAPPAPDLDAIADAFRKGSTRPIPVGPPMKFKPKSQRTDRGTGR
ncbi:MAG TPA: hypothetical protein VMG31_16920 [Verrucomicrobiae bacterium]|nr:hypothetical protein [Verrucomicrobiae bacterium]